MRIGVFGGSFDPPHLGHVAVATAAQEHAKLDLVLFVPAGQQWQKQHSASADLRAHMLSLLIRQHTDWLVNSVDVDRQLSTFTIDTMSDVAKQWPGAELFFVLGHDAATHLSSWHRSDELAKLVTFIDRPGHTTQLPAGFRLQEINVVTPEISSTSIRDLVAHVPQDEKLKALTPLVGEDVAQFITLTGLYS